MSDPADLREIERQLSFPEGARGVEMGVMMNETNINMTMASIEALDPKPNDTILEPGHGNGGHIPRLLSLAPGLHYTGLEISPTMHEEARKLTAAVPAGRIHLQCYDGLRIPFPDEAFDKIFTVNTIYFWKNPKAMMTELSRVVKRNGIVVITYANKDFMKHLPFVGDRFRLYDDDDLRALVDDSPLHAKNITHHSEQVKSKAGEMVTRTYSVAILSV